MEWTKSGRKWTKGAKKRPREGLARERLSDGTDRDCSRLGPVLFEPVKNSARFDAAITLIPAAAEETADALNAKKDRILTGFGAVKTEEKTVKAGVSFGSASALKAAKWAGVSAAEASVFASAWALSVALDAVTAEVKS